MAIQKIKGGRVNNVIADEHIGDKGSLFYNEDLGDLRLSDGITKGGIPLQFNSSGVLRLAPATDTVIGGVIIGDGLKIDSSGVLSVDIIQPENTPVATIDTLGTVKVGAGLTIDSSGELSADVQPVPMASTTVLGGIKIGDGFVIDENGVLGVATFLNTDGGSVSTNYGGTTPLNGGGI
jgi:hypothetical protein